MTTTTLCEQSAKVFKAAKAKHAEAARLFQRGKYAKAEAVREQAYALDRQFATMREKARTDAMHARLARILGDD